MLRALLSPSQRDELFNIPDHISEQALVKHYTFSAEDLSLIKKQREGHNRLGFALQLAYLRFPGRSLQPGEDIPASLLSYIAAQLHLSPLVFHRYAKRDTTRRQHARKIQQYLKLHQLIHKDEHVLRTLLLPVALQTGSNIAVVAALLEQMRQRNITIPAVSTIERITYVIQEEARRILLTELTAHLTAEQKGKLDGLSMFAVFLDKIDTHLKDMAPQAILKVDPSLEEAGNHAYPYHMPGDHLAPVC